MKSSSGRAQSAATSAVHVAAAAVCGVALAFLPATSAQAQIAATHGPAVRDGTPEIDAAIAQKNWESALKQLDARIASNPHDAQAKFKRGTVLAHLNRDDDAIAQFTELTQSFPELPEPYNNLAALYAKQGRYDEARAALETAVKANPSYGLAYENLGDLYLRLASESYKRAQSLGHASGTTALRIAQIQRIVSPAPKAAAATSASNTGAYTARATSNITDQPSFTFGGPNGSLAMPPYMAPSQ